MKYINLDEWFSSGYTRYSVSPATGKHADFMVQKRIIEHNKTKYYITVYVYDRKKYPYYNSSQAEYGYMPTAYYFLGHDKPFFDIEMNQISSISEVEEYFEKFWVILGKPCQDLS